MSDASPTTTVDAPAERPARPPKPGVASDPTPVTAPAPARSPRPFRWCGVQFYGCPFCAYDTDDEAAIHAHLALMHPTNDGDPRYRSVPAAAG